MKKLLLLLLLLAVCSPGLIAQTLNGRLGTSAYGWQRQTAGGDATSQFRAYQNLQLNYGTRDISFHTYMQGSTDFSNKMEFDPMLRLFNAYLRVKNVMDAFDLQLGRFPIYAGVNYGTVDGARLKIHTPDEMQFMVYAGGLTPPSQKAEFFENVNDNWQLGGQLLLFMLKNTRIGLSYMNRHRESTPFTRIAWDPSLGQDVTSLIDYGSRANQYASVNASWEEGQWWLYGRYDYDFNFASTSRGEFAAGFRPTQELGISLNLAHREPVIAYNSYFSLFEASANQEAVLGIDYFVNEHVTVLGRVSAVAYEDDQAYRVSLGATNKYASLMYTKDVSYDGDLDGFNFQLTHPFAQGKLIPHIGAIYSTYALSKDLQESQTTWAGVVGATYRPLKTLSVDLQGQYLTNKIYKSDSRIFVRFNYWFADTFGIGR